jgi:aminoglycoside 3-N-acetyltransferase
MRMKNKLMHVILKNSPEWSLEIAKRIKKTLRNKVLHQQKKKGGFSKADLISEFKKIGIAEGDVLLVHSSLSKIGFVQDGPSTVIQALLETIGITGTLLMPSFPAKGRNKDYLQTQSVFDVMNTPSAMGIITEEFRKMPGVKRSLHPTDPVCALGPLADFLTSTHLGRLTPYDQESPFRKLADKNGKILMLGTTLNGAGTSLHTLEDAVDFPHPVYDNQIFEVQIIDENGKTHLTQTKVHNPVCSTKRNCDALVPIFEKEKVLTRGKVAEATTLLLDAHKMFETMVKYFHEYGVTMYTPYGDKNQLA